MSERKTPDVSSFFGLVEEICLVATPDGEILKVNEAFRHVLGWPEGDFRARSLFELIHLDDLKALAEVLQTLSQSSDPQPLQTVLLRTACRGSAHRQIE